MMPASWTTPVSHIPITGVFATGGSDEFDEDEGELPAEDDSEFMRLLHSELDKVIKFYTAKVCSNCAILPLTSELVAVQGAQSALSCSDPALGGSAIVPDVRKLLLKIDCSNVFIHNPFFPHYAGRGSH